MKTEIISILDRSGSMGMLVSDTIGGYNSFLADQKKLDGECKVTTVLFDDRYEELYSAVDIKNVKDLTSKEYFVRSTTALYDAIGRATTSAGARFAKMSESDRPDKVIVLIITDGFENASKEFTLSQIKEMIQHQESKYSWEFVYLGANQDAFDVGSSMGMKMSNVATYAATSTGTTTAYAGFSAKTTSFRCGLTADAVVMADAINK